MNHQTTNKPANWDYLVKQFPNIKWENIVVTYGGVIHSKHPLPPDVLAHEMVHVEQQQGIDKDEYVERFISDKNFRYEMELKAYQVQLRYWAEKLANDLSGSIYGNIVSYEQAIKDIYVYP